MNLYGNDMDETTTPLESGLAWTVAWEPQDRDFIGRAALAAQKSAGVPRKLVGLLLEDRGVLRSHQKVIVPAVGEGEVTSGTFSPTLERSIGLARVPAATADRCEVEIRGRLLSARVVRPPFVRNGTIAISLLSRIVRRDAMSKVPHDLGILKTHEWARLETDGTVTVGISDHAQQALGDLVFVEVPERGPPRRRRRGDRGRRIGQGRVRRLQPRRAARSSPAMRISADSPS